MAMILAAVIALVPLLITPHLLFYFDITPKLVVLLLGAAFSSIYCFRSPVLSPSRWFSVLLGAQALALALATISSTSPALSLGGTNWRRFGLLAQGAVLLFTFVATAWLAGNITRVLFVLRVMAASGVFAALYGILQYFGWDPFLPARAYHVGEGVWTIVRPPGTLGHADYYGTYLLSVVFAGVALALAEETQLWKALGAAAAALGSFAIVLSGTRAAILGLVMGGAFLLLWRRPRIAPRALALVALALAALAVFYYSPPGRQLRSRARWYVEDPLGGARLLLWRDSTRMAAHRPLLGYGPETFSSQFPRFQSVALARAYPDFYYESPHNVFLDALTSAGLLNLAALIGLCVLGFQAAWRARTKMPKLAGALGAALAATLASQQFIAFTVPTALYLYLAFALLVSLAPDLPAGTARRRTIALALALPLAALLAIFAVRYFEADRALALAVRDLDSANLPGALREYNRVRAWQPPGCGSDLWYSRRLALFAQTAPAPEARLQAWEQALKAGVRALATAEDRQNAYYSLAGFYAAQNDFARTESALRSAAEWAPNWFKPHWMLAQVLRAAGRLAEAEKEAALAATLDAGKNSEVASTLAQVRAARRALQPPAGAPPVNSAPKPLPPK